MNFKNMNFLMLFVAFLIGYLFNYIIKRCSVIEGHTKAGDHYSTFSDFSSCDRVYNNGWNDAHHGGDHDDDWWDANLENYRLCKLSEGKNKNEYIRTCGHDGKVDKNDKKKYLECKNGRIECKK